jgi:hypothetical protein
MILIFNAEIMNEKKEVVKFSVIRGDIKSYQKWKHLDSSRREFFDFIEMSFKKNDLFLRICEINFDIFGKEVELVKVLFNGNVFWCQKSFFTEIP